MPKRRKAPKSGAKPPRVPAYCLHRASGQAYIKAGGRVVYLGVHGSAESREAYAEAVAGVLKGQPVMAPGRRGAVSPAGTVTVRDVCDRYVKHAEGYYCKNGEPTREVGLIRNACGVAAELLGEAPVTAFGPLALGAVRDRLVADGLARSTVNGAVRRIRRAFRWAASRELIPASVPQALATVDGLRAGRTTARETAPVMPVEDAVVEATLPHLPEVVADMVRLQRLTGMRPGEVCALRPCELDRSGDVWTFRPGSHKTEHHGRQRVVFIGPKGQAVLLRYLARDAEACCFRPCDSEAKRRAEVHAARVTPMSCGNRPGKGVATSPLRPPGEKYEAAAYARAIERAAKKARVPHWTPNQLRHTAGTEVRAKFGLEAAQTILGHATAKMTEHYAEKHLAAGAEVARVLG